MPNWCTNNAEIHHDDPKQIERVVEAFKRGDLCETFLPIKQLPTSEQYDAAINTWGTKWDVGQDDGAVSISEDGKSVYLSFESAWTPPVGLYNELVRLGFDVIAEYFEPGVAFVGQYENGTDECFDYSSDTIDEVVPARLVEVFNIHDWYDTDDAE
jgi:hypothetical protein